MSARKSYTESCDVLRKQGVMADEEPASTHRSSPHDSGRFGIGFFRTRLADASLDGLTLPRTFFGRSEIRNVSFRNTDLSESTANWNDFIHVDLSDADLSRTDFRGSVFARVNFSGAVLRRADFRGASFRACTFRGADLAGAKLTRGLGWVFRLSRAQRAVVDWYWPLDTRLEGS